MKLTEYLEKDRDRLESRLLQARTPLEAQQTVMEQYDRVLYRFNEDCESERVRSEAAHMIQTARMSVALMSTASEAKVWKRDAEKKEEKKAPGTLFWLLLVLGIAALAAGLGMFLTNLQDQSGAGIAALVTAAGAALLFFSGMRLKRASRKTEPKPAEQKVEILIDSKSVLSTMQTVLQSIDHNLEQAQEEENWAIRAAKEKQADSGPSEEELQLYSGLLEAACSGDGDTALEALENVKYYLHTQGIETVNYDPEHESWFDRMPSHRQMTLRPALARDGRLLRKGLAAGGEG